MKNLRTLAFWLAPLALLGTILISLYSLTAQAREPITIDGSNGATINNYPGGTVNIYCTSRWGRCQSQATRPPRKTFNAAKKTYALAKACTVPEGFFKSMYNIAIYPMTSVPVTLVHFDSVTFVQFGNTIGKPYSYDKAKEFRREYTGGKKVCSGNTLEIEIEDTLYSSDTNPGTAINGRLSGHLSLTYSEGNRQLSGKANLKVNGQESTVDLYLGLP